MSKKTPQRLLILIIAFVAILVLQFAFSSPGAEAQSGVPDGSGPVLKSGTQEGTPAENHGGTPVAFSLPANWAGQAQPANQPARSGPALHPGWHDVITEDFEDWPSSKSSWELFDGNNNGSEQFWGADDFKPSSGTYSAWPGRDGAHGVDPEFFSYYDNMNSWMKSYWIDLSDASAAEAQFQLWRETEAVNDYVLFGVSTDGSNFLGYKWWGNGAVETQWHEIIMDFADIGPQYVGAEQVWVVWYFYSNSSNSNYYGPFVDDIVVRAYLPAPVPDFSGTPTSGVNPLEVSFTDLSQSTGGGITDWLWDFGDGGSSALQNPAHTYNSDGDYTVSLTVTNINGSATETKTNYISVADLPPTADFSGTPTSGTKPLEVSFTDESTGTVTSYDWDFGDGETSIDPNPTHTYDNAGQYTVKLTVTGPGGSNSKTRTNYINVAEPAPTADFSGTPRNGIRPLEVSFTDESTGVVSSWDWDFGDGGSSTQANPIYTYTTAGQYTVKLTVTGPGGSDSKTQTDYINVSEPNQPPVADFSATPLFGGRPLNVSFTNTSTGDISSYDWDFGDGGSSTQPNPSHEYTANGLYTVSLTVSGPGGSDSKTQTNYISVTDPEPSPVADFSGTPVSGLVPLTVDFSDLSSGNITSWSWDFGDGGTSTAGSPNHTYNTAGDYTVKLTVTGPGGSNTKTRTNYIHVDDTVAPPVADFSAAPRTGNRPLIVGFQDLSTGNISSYAWDFGDGVTSTESRPVHKYETAGDFTVKLTVSGPGGSNSKTRTNYIHVDDPTPPPVADFSGSPLSGRAPLTVNFTDQSTGVISSYLWKFGINQTSTLANPSHTFTSQGLYAIGLTVTGPGGSDSEVKINYINVLPPGPPPPVADFTADKWFGNFPLTVSFSDRSSGNVTQWNWKFGDGGSSTQRNPVHTYFPGVYNVTLVVSGPNGDSDTKEIKRYIHVFDPSTTLDFDVDYNAGLEVTQGIQDLNNYVRLVAGKRTFVRFYASSNQGDHAGEAAMIVKREGDTNYKLLWPINTADVGVMQEPNRGHINHSFLFELPERYTHGKVSMAAELNPRRNIKERSFSNNTAVFEANFEPVPTMNLVLYSVGYGKDDVYWPKSIHRTQIEDWLQRAYPVSDIKITHRNVFIQTIPDVLICEGINGKTCDPGTLSPNTTYYWRVNTRYPNGGVRPGPVWHFTTGSGSNNLTMVPSNPSPANGATNQSINANLSWSDSAKPPNTVYDVYFEAEGALPTADHVNSLLADKRNTDLANHAISPDAHYYGLVDDGGGFMRGKAAGIPAHVSSGPAGDHTTQPWMGWDTDGSYADFYTGHELGHSYGAFHIYDRRQKIFEDGVWKDVKSGPCEARGGSDSFPNRDGLISPFVGTSRDFYGFDIHSKEIYGPEWHDVMSYCDNQWISEYNYENIMDFIQKPPILNVLNQVTAVEDRLSVVGTIYPATQNVDLLPLFIVPDADNVDPAVPGPYAIVLRSTAGVELARYPFTAESMEYGPPDPDSDEPEIQVLAISELVPYVDGTSRVDIEHDGTLLSSITAGEAPPKVTVTTPNGGENLAGDSIHVAWTGSDPDDDPLIFNVQYSANNGQQWETVAYYLSATEVDIDAANIPGSDEGLFRVLVSDGVHTAYDESDAPFTVPNRVPTTTLFEPAPGATYVISQTVGLRASAYDVDTGTMAPNLLQWSSNRDGDLGSGQQLSVSDLSLGVHTITFRADDGQGGVAEENVEITVLAEAPPAADKLIAGPTTIILNSTCGQPNPTLSLTNQNFDNAIGWTAVTSEPWLQLSSKTGSTPANLKVSFDDAGLDPGIYAAEITFSSAATPGQSEIVRVTLEIVEDGACSINLPFIIGYPGQ